MFTRISNFTYGKYHIANIDEADKNQSVALTICIQEAEDEALRMVLGDCLYSDFMSNLELDNDGYWKVKDDADPKWEKLLNGESYDAPENLPYVSGCCCCNVSCQTHYWDGIVKVSAKVKNGNDTVEVISSILAPYIYLLWSQDHRTLSLGVGQGNGEAQTATMTGTKRERIRAWNKFVEYVHIGSIGGRVPLQQYLKEHPADFGNVPCLEFNVIPYPIG